jgi:hypothetical protein
MPTLSSFIKSKTPPNTAVHSVFFMGELQRYITKFLGPDSGEDESDGDHSIEDENSLGDY